MTLSPDEKHAIEAVANLVKLQVSDQTPLCLLRHTFVTLDKLLKMARMPDEPDPKALDIITNVLERNDLVAKTVLVLGTVHDIHQALVRYYKTGETPTAPLTDKERQTVYDWVDDVVIKWDPEAPSVLKTKWHNLKRMLDEQRAAEEEASKD